MTLTLYKKAEHELVLFWIPLSIILAPNMLVNYLEANSPMEMKCQNLCSYLDHS